MGLFDIVLIDNRILHGRINLRMTENLLNLLNGHAFVNGSGGHRAAELMRMDTVNAKRTPQDTQADFDAADLQAMVRGIQWYE